MMKTQRGFTLVEMIVGIALMGILGLVTASFFVFTAKTKNEITNEIEDKVDNILAERMLLKDLKFSEPSFNNLLITDDSGFRFFDYAFDTTDQVDDNRERKFTLDVNNKKEFTFLVTAEKLGASVMYTPSVAYEIGEIPASPNVAASLTFQSLNKGGELAKSRVGYWQPGVVLMLDTPAMVREMTSTGPNYKRPARSPVFVGVVQAPGATRLKRVDLPNFVDYSNPMYPSETVTDEDYFLRNVPPLGGAAPLVRLKAVYIIKYYLEKDKTTGRVSLYRSTYDANGFQSGQLFATNVSKVEFTRKSARDALIYFKIIRE